MIDKRVASLTEAMAGIRDGATVLMAGFGEVGAPHALLDALIVQGATNLTLVVNSAGRIRVPGQPATGIARLIELGRVRKVITSFVRSNSIAGEAVRDGRMVAEVVPQGTLAERMRAALHGDVALIEAWQADRWGNLTYRDSGRNFNPIMAMAGKLTIVQAHHIVELGELPPNDIVTPGIFVDRVLHLAVGDPKLPR